MSIPKSTPVKITPKDDHLVKTHPSFGMLSFSRVDGSSGPLFGSDLETPSFIRMTLLEGQEDWHLSRKWHHGRGTIVELDMTNSQFAEIITNMNRGSGIPTTIRFRADQGHVPGFLVEDTLHDQIRADLKHDIKEIVDTADKLAADLDKTLAESGLSKAKQQSLRDSINKLRRDLTANMPFVLDQYKEALDKTASSAKIEVETFITHKAQELGFQTLTQLAQAALPEGKK